MSICPHVTYWRLKKGAKPERVESQCFGTMSRSGVPEGIRYICPISKTEEGKELTNDMVDFYLGFMKRLITTPHSPKFLVRRLKRQVHFKMECSGMKYIDALFFLQWARYPREFPEHIYELWNGRKEEETDEEMFTRFQVSHNLVAIGKFRVSSQYAESHGLSYNVERYTGSVKPITIAELQENIKLKPSMVHAYFRKPVTKL